jgi:hypothetical protein
LQIGETSYGRTSAPMGIVIGRIVVELERADRALPEEATLSYTGGDKVPRR